MIQIRTGELEFAPQISQVVALGLRGVPGLQTRSATTYTDVELGFNTKRTPFEDVRVRRALAAPSLLGLNRRCVAVNIPESDPSAVRC